MNRIFFRFFLLVMLAITLATFAIYFSLRLLFVDPLDDIAYRQAAAPIALLERYIDRAPPDEWLVRLNKAREVSDIELELVPLQAAASALPPERRAALLRGELTVDIAHKSVLRRVDLNDRRYAGSSADVIALQGLPIDVAVALKIEALRFAIVALCLLVPAALWSRSHWRDLQALAAAADRFGAGQLATRAEIGPSAAIYPLAQRMNHMAERIASLLEAHKTLLHSVSHELRTPIARLQFGLELARQASTDDARMARLDAMQADLLELETLVGELLQLAETGQRPLARSAFPLAALLHETLDRLDHGNGGKSVARDFGGDCGDCHGEPRLLARAVSNLVRNAQRHARARITVSAQRLPDGAIRIAVDDDGPGIAPLERERVFDAFYRTDQSRDRDTGGFGLGLAIARAAVRAHGGTLHARESKLGGASLVIDLPE